MASEFEDGEAFSDTDVGNVSFSNSHVTPISKHTQAILSQEDAKPSKTKEEHWQKRLHEKDLKIYQLQKQLQEEQLRSIEEVQRLQKHIADVEDHGARYRSAAKEKMKILEHMPLAKEEKLNEEIAELKEQLKQINLDNRRRNHEHMRVKSAMEQKHRMEIAGYQMKLQQQTEQFEEEKRNLSSQIRTLASRLNGREEDQLTKSQMETIDKLHAALVTLRAQCESKNAKIFELEERLETMQRQVDFTTSFIAAEGGSSPTRSPTAAATPKSSLKTHSDIVAIAQSHIRDWQTAPTPQLSSPIERLMRKSENFTLQSLAQQTPSYLDRTAGRSFGTVDRDQITEGSTVAALKKNEVLSAVVERLEHEGMAGLVSALTNTILNVDESMRSLRTQLVKAATVNTAMMRKLQGE